MPVSLTALDQPYTQNFDTLATAGNSSTVPEGVLFSESTNETTYAAGTGNLNGGNTYSFGAANSTDRAFGTLRSAANIPTIGFSFTNNTGQAITSLVIGYTGEQWRLGALNRADRLDFQYSLNATSLTSGTYVDVDALDFIAPTTTGTVGALDGNAAANQAASAFTITGLNIAPGATFFLRWNDADAAGADDGLAIDNFTLTARGAGPTLPTLSIDDVSLSEGNAGTVIYTFTVSLSAPAPAGGVTFDIATADGTATTANGDFLAQALTGQTIPAGSSSYTFAVTVNADTIVEPNESFFVNIANVSGATVGDGQGAGTITNDDVPPAGTFAIGPVTQTFAEGNTGQSVLTFTVMRTGGSTGAATVGYTTTFGQGLDPADFTAGQTFSGTVNFEDGDAEDKTISFTVIGDTAVEADEVLTVTLGAPSVGSLGQASAAATITNDDSSFTIAAGRASEGAGSVPLVVTRTGLLNATTLDYTVTLGTATADDFGAGYATGQVSFAAGAATATINVPIANDAVTEPNETFTVTLSGAQPGQTITTASATGTISNDDGSAYHSLAGGTFSQNWTDTSLITADDDWSGVASILGFRGDDLTGATGTNPGTITGTSAVIDVIANQNNAASISGGVAEFQLVDPTIGLQGSGTADAPYIAIYLDATGRQDVAVSYRLRDLDASADNAAQQVALQYRVGETGDWINVPSAFVNDATTGPSLLGPDTLVSAVLPAEANGQSRLQVRIITANAVGNDEWVGVDDITVTSNVGRPSLSVADASVIEANAGATAITFTVTRAGDSVGAVSADYAVALTGNSTANDFVAGEPLSGTVSFADGEISRQITLQVQGDAAPENDETFEVVLSNVSGGLLSDARATGTILNDDGPPPLVTIGDVSRSEGDAGTSIFEFTVTRSGGTGPFTVDYLTTGGTATAGEDYDLASGQLQFLEGETTKTIAVTVRGDVASETTETFGVQLFNPTGFAVITDGAGTGTIVNDDRIFIHDVQGTAYYSPILAADGISGFNVASTSTVVVQAVVTALDDEGARQGFYITEESDDWDLSIASSEGIFVMTRNDASAGTTLSAAVPGLRVGDLVTVTAQVMEYQSFATMPRTVLVNSVVAINGNDRALPTLLLDESRPIPNAILTPVTPDYTDSADGAGDTFDVGLYGLSFWESVEGMLVTIPDMVAADGFVQTAGGQPYFQAYSTVHADADQINSRGGYTIAGDPPLSPPDTDDAEDGTSQGGRHLHDGDINPDIVEVDFSGFAIDAPAGLTQNLTMGDKLGDVTGIIDFDFTDRKLFVTRIDPAAITNGVPTQETTLLGNDARALTVATFNVENLDPGDGAARFTAIANAIANNLNSPDIISIEEMQDNNGATASGGSDASMTWQMLVDALNAAVPGARYQWVDQAPVPGSEGGEPGGNIRVGFLYNTERVQLGNLAADATIEQRRQFTDRIGDGVRDAGDRIVFSDDRIAGEINAADWSGTRLSLLGQFTFNGNSVYVTANHWPAKGGSGEFWQFNQNLELGDPDNSGWAKRSAVAQDVYTMLNLIEGNSGGAGVIAGGDFNDFYFYRPLEAVTGHVLADGTPRTGGARFDNLTVTELTEAERYTYTFDGRSQAIDHIIVNKSLSAVASYDVVHLNTGYNSNGTGANADPSLSDHDPAVASFDFRDFSEVFRLEQGGDDDLSGFGGLDTFVFGGTFTGGDRVDGGAGNDVLALQGDYSAGVTFGAGVRDIASVSLYSGGNNQFGLGSANLYDYNLTTVDGNVAAGQQLRINGANLQAGEDLTFNGAAETDGVFQVLGGLGVDTVTGGSGNDVVVFGPGGRFAAGDTVTGGAGYDVVYLKGNYTADLTAPGFAGAFAGVESIGLLSATNTEFVSAGGATEFDYSITWADALLGAGQTITVNGSRLTAEESMSFNGSAETNGIFRLFGGGGNDVLTGGTGNDLIFGGARGDTLTGGAGNDVFRYQSVEESNSTERDGIQDFNAGDLIDLSRIDAISGTAENDAFSFIGSAAFSGTAGQLRFENISLDGPIWMVQGDIDGDGVSDFEVVLVISPPDPITTSDFLL